jgi:UDP-N-acetyl-2-amino-2-deoxyglucuronate dehydrogenase
LGSSIGFAVIGCGVIGSTHVQAIDSIEKAHLAVLCSRPPDRARELAEQYGAAWCSDFQEAIAHPDVDAVSVCTPSGFHAPPALAALEAGKHVLVEKPMEITLDKADQMIEAADRARCCLGVVFQMRFRPVMQYVKAAVDAGKLGRITLGEASVKCYRSPDYFRAAEWRGTWALDGGGALMNQGIHFVDLLLWLMGPVQSVTAYADTLLHSIEVEDTLVASMRFDNGALGVIEATTTAFPHLSDRLEIVGTQGSIRIENGQLCFKYLADEDGTDVGLYGLHSDQGWRAAEAATLTGEGGHRAQIADFVSAIREGRPPAVDGQEGRRSLALVTAIYESARTGRKVSIVKARDGGCRHAG